MRLRRVQKCISNLLGEHRFVGVDVGARGDIPAPWLPLDGIASIISFEPDETACEALARTYAARGNGHLYTIRPVAVTRDGGDRTVYVTNVPSGSSMFDPDTALLREYVDSDYLFPIRKVTIPTSAIHQEFESLGEMQLDLMKLDVQGCEFEVLEGMGHDLLETVVCIETEAAMRDRGPDYPSFFELHSLLAERGFELANIWPVSTHRAKNGDRAAYLQGDLGIRRGAPSVAARGWEADVLYVRSFRELFDQNASSRLRKLVISLCIYGFYVEALYGVEEGGRRGLFEREEVEQHRRDIIEWHRNAHFRPWHADTWLGRLVGDLLRKLGMHNLESPLINIHRQ